MSKTIILVSCVSKKRLIPSPASELYISDWFLKASDFARKYGDEWFILSAKYGLLPPDKVISPYNETLNTMSLDARRSWTRRVFQDLEKNLEKGNRVVFLAGAAYREFLIPSIRGLGCEISIPMEGFRIGEQMQWLNHQLGK